MPPDVTEDPFESQTAKIAPAARCLKRLVGRAFDRLRHNRFADQRAVCVLDAGSTFSSFTFATMLSSAIWAVVSSVCISPIRIAFTPSSPLRAAIARAISAAASATDVDRAD